MNEEAWLTYDDPAAMLAFLRGGVSDRKLWLFAAGTCWRHWQPAGAQGSALFGRAYALIDRHAEGQAGEEELAGLGWRLLNIAPEEVRRYLTTHFATHFHPDPNQVAEEASSALLAFVVGEARRQAGMSGSSLSPFDRFRLGVVRDKETREQAALLRELVGNPFRPVDPGPGASGAGEVQGFISRLAQEMYDTRQFDRMPILGDALEDAGCSDQAVLAHCHQPVGHARGCWVLDRLVGKE